MILGLIDRKTLELSKQQVATGHRNRNSTIFLLGILSLLLLKTEPSFAFPQFTIMPSKRLSYQQVADFPGEICPRSPLATDKRVKHQLPSSSSSALLASWYHHGPHRQSSYSAASRNIRHTQKTKSTPSCPAPTSWDRIVNTRNGKSCLGICQAKISSSDETSDKNLWFLEETEDSSGRSTIVDMNMKDATSSHRTVGRIVRIAVKSYHPQSSKPRSRSYSPRKVAIGVSDSLPSNTTIGTNGQTTHSVTAQGIEGDYNHYRSSVLRNTTNRAISIVTLDVMELLRNSTSDILGESHNLNRHVIQNGDLGENILVDDFQYNDLAVGQRYRLQESVVLEITEPMIPCINLCQLPYINDDQKEPRERIDACHSLMHVLDVERGPGRHGIRGWYAKVVQEGELKVPIQSGGEGSDYPSFGTLTLVRP